MAIAKIYIISDTHFGHKNILRYRTHERFPEFVGAEMTPQEHDQKLEERILETVNRKDTLWMLGDSFFSMDSLDVLRRIRARVARLNLVLGNHCFQNCPAGEGLATEKMHSIVIDQAESKQLVQCGFNERWDVQDNISRLGHALLPHQTRHYASTQGRLHGFEG